MIDARGEGLGRHADDSRQVARGIDHGVPTLPGKRAKVFRAVTMDLFHVRKEAGVGLSAVENGHYVSCGKRGYHQVPSDEYRPAQDQDLHAFAPASGFPPRVLGSLAALASPGLRELCRAPVRVPRPGWPVPYRSH